MTVSPSTTATGDPAASTSAAIAAIRASAGNGRAEAGTFGRAHDGPRGQDLGPRRVGGEGRDIVGGRPEQQLLGRADLDDPAVLHDGDAVGQAHRLVEIVGDEDDGLVQQLLQPEELVLHLAADQRIERREWLVEKPELRPDGERAGDADPLLLAAGELAWEVAFPPLEPDQLDHLARPRLAGLARHALDGEREGDIAQHGEMRQQREMLEDHAHLVAPKLDELGLAHGQQVPALEQNLAGSGLDQP